MAGLPGIIYYNYYRIIRINHTLTSGHIPPLDLPSVCFSLSFFVSFFILLYLSFITLWSLLCFQCRIKSSISHFLPFSPQPLFFSLPSSLSFSRHLSLSVICYLSLSFCLSSLFIPLFACRLAITNVHLPKDPLWFLNQPPHEYNTNWLSVSYEGTLLWMQIRANTLSK